MPELVEGKKAPLFTLNDGNGNSVALKDFIGRPIVLYFYPKDMTPGCTTEACDFKDAFPEFNKLNAVVFGISKDSVSRHQKFSEKYGLPFQLLSDEGGKVVEKYGVWVEKNNYGIKYRGIERSTFIIEEDGKFKKIFRKVKVKGHIQELLNLLQ